MPIAVPGQVKPYLNEIAGQLWSNKAAVMVGAGFSRNAKPVGSTSASFPSWQELGDCFFNKLYGGQDPSKEDRYLSILKLADQIAAAFGRPTLDKLLHHAIPDLMYQPSLLHSQLLDLPWKDVFTTNYDTLLERARAYVTPKHYDVVVTKGDLLYANQPRIIKLHGSFPSPPFVITEEDYRRYPNDHAPFVNTVRQSLLENTLCLIGFSGNDPNFLQWIGWMQDHIGKETAPNIYLVGMFDMLSEADRKLLDSRGIVVVDLSIYDTDPGNALGNFFESLEDFSKERKKRILNWPITSANALNIVKYPNRSDYDKVVVEWRQQRGEYPGWVVMPEDQRQCLWFNTKDWLLLISKMSSDDYGQLETPLDLDLAFELAWRLDRCLFPLVEKLPSFLENVANKYNGETLQLPENTHWTKTSMSEAVANIRLWLLRHYREGGLHEKWLKVRKAIKKGDSERLLPEHRARLCLEEALQALFRFNPDKAKQLLVDWQQSNDILPFWEAKRAALMAELGETSFAYSILETSLSAIRQQLSLNPVTKDYTLVSQESIVMLLLQAVDSARTTDTKDSSDKIKIPEMSERRRELARYKCDPYHEIELLSACLQHPVVSWRSESKTNCFDLGIVSQTLCLDKIDNELIMAYRMLRMYEDIGMPYRISVRNLEKHCRTSSLAYSKLLLSSHTKSSQNPEIEPERFYSVSLVKKEVESTLPRIRSYFSHWALANIIRLGNANIDTLFDREYLSGLTSEKVDKLLEIYLPALERTIDMVEKSDLSSAKNFELLAKTLPDVLSRLCCKCSPVYWERLVGVLRAIYDSKRRGMFEKISQFAKRLFGSMSFEERARIVPLLIDFPVLDRLSEREREFINPVCLIFLPLSLSRQAPHIAEERIDELFFAAKREQSQDWAMMSLVWLSKYGKLNQHQSDCLGKLLWNEFRTLELELPNVTNCPSYEYIKLPHPQHINPELQIKKHLRSLLGEQVRSSCLSSRLDNTLDELYNSAKLIKWSWPEALELVEELSGWHKKYKSQLDYLLLHGLSFAEMARVTIRKVISALSTIFLYLPPNNDDERVKSVRKLLEEFTEYNIPAKVLDVAILSKKSKSWEELLKKVMGALLHNNCYIVEDALLAANIFAYKFAEEESRDEFDPIAAMLVQGIQWRRRPGLIKNLIVVTNLVEEQSWFLSRVEINNLLAGLEQIAEETLSGVRGNDENEVITIRAEAASLAFALFKYYQESKLSEPGVIQSWRKLCSDPNEFSEVKNSWADINN